ncbi:unnamed protein product [Urochloa humidicola]
MVSHAGRSRAATADLRSARGAFTCRDAEASRADIVSHDGLSGCLAWRTWIQSPAAASVMVAGGIVAVWVAAARGKRGGGEMTGCATPSQALGLQQCQRLRPLSPLHGHPQSSRMVR